jgi:SLAP domain-containing protein
MDVEESVDLYNKYERVFVYGTLRNNESNHHLLSNAECLFERCWTYGKLYDTGLGYPTMVELQNGADDGEVKPKISGEIYRVTAIELEKLNELEGYSAQSIAANLYDRIRQPIYTDQGVIEALVYVNGSLPITEEQRIASGDWKEYLETRQRVDSHQLILEDTWERAVSTKDREIIQEIFDVSPHPQDNEVVFLPIRAGINYENRLFATVLIQNGGEQDLIFDNFPLFFHDNSIPIAEHKFTIKELVVQANTSTPWTFIFPKETMMQKNLHFLNWSLRT